MAFNILCLNCCSLQKRLNYHEFQELISMYDILWFVESKSDDLDFFDIPGYEVKMKNRKKVAKVKSGGITIAYKTEISDKIQLIATESKFVLWFKIASTYLNLEEDIVVGVIYIPPQKICHIPLLIHLFN